MENGLCSIENKPTIAPSLCANHCAKKLTRSGRSVEQHSLGRLDSDADEEFRVGERQLNHLSQLSDLIVQSTDIAVGEVARRLVEHVEDHGVDLARQVAHDRQRRHVERDARASLQLLLVHLVADTNDVARTVGGLHND